MALTQTSWTKNVSGKQTIISCSVTATTAENDAYTKWLDAKLMGLDTTRQFSLIYYASATPDGQALPLDIWVGWTRPANGGAEISGDGANVVCANGAKFKQIFDDVVLAVDDTPLAYVFNIDPDLAVADVVTVGAIATGPKVKVPPMPCIAFNANGGSTLAAVTHYFKILQHQK